jgi:hypothetical protein
MDEDGGRVEDDSALGGKGRASSSARGEHGGSEGPVCALAGRVYAERTASTHGRDVQMSKLEALGTLQHRPRRPPSWLVILGGSRGCPALSDPSAHGVPVHRAETFAWRAGRGVHLASCAYPL